MSIPHELALLLFRSIKKNILITVQIYNVFILAGIDFLLSHKDFIINGQFYIPVMEASMGAKFSPYLLICLLVGGESYFVRQKTFC